MAEPAPIVESDAGRKCQSAGQLRLRWETSSEAYDEFERGQRAVKIEYYLQARTQYDTRVIRPESKATSDETRPNQRSEITHLGTFEVRSMDRDNVQLESVTDGWRCHTGTIQIPIQVAKDTVPTFSHSLASRHYLLLVKLQIQCLQHKALTIKVPVQVCGVAAETKSDEYEAEIYGDMLLSEVRRYPFLRADSEFADS
jgi:hypothetical protein